MADLLDLILEDEDFAGEPGVREHDPRPHVVDLRAVETAVLRGDVEKFNSLKESALAASGGVQSEFRELLEDLFRTGGYLVEGLYEKVLFGTNAGRWLLREHDAEKEGRHAPACDRFDSLVAMFVRRSSQFVELGSKLVDGRLVQEPRAGLYSEHRLEDCESDILHQDGADEEDERLRDILGRRMVNRPEAFRAVCVSWVGAALLLLHLQCAGTGPELSADDLERMYPLPFAMQWLREAAPAEAEAGIRSRQDATTLMRARRQAEAVHVQSPAHVLDQAKDETPHKKEQEEEEEEGGKEEDDRLLRRLNLPRSKFHSAALAALSQSAGGVEAYEHSDLPHFLVTAWALLRSLSGVGVQIGGSSDTNGFITIPKMDEPDEERAVNMFFISRYAAVGSHWWTLRTAKAVLENCVDAGEAAQAGMLQLAREAAQLAGKCWTPHTPSAYTTADIFQRNLVHSTLEATGVRGARSKVGIRSGGGMSKPDESILSGGGASASKLSGGDDATTASKLSGGDATATASKLSGGDAATTASKLSGGDATTTASKSATASDSEEKWTRSNPKREWTEEEMELLGIAGETTSWSGGQSSFWLRDETSVEVRKAILAAETGEPWTCCSLREWIRGDKNLPPVYEARQVAAQLLLEWGLVLHVMGLHSSARTCFLLAKRDSGLQTHMTGRLGRRTKFQTFDVTLLVLRAASEIPPEGSSEFFAGSEAARKDGMMFAREVSHEETDADTNLLPSPDWRSRRDDTGSSMTAEDEAPLTDARDVAAKLEKDGLDVVEEDSSDAPSEKKSGLEVAPPKKEDKEEEEDEDEWDSEDEIVPDNETWKQVSSSAEEWRAKLGGPADSAEDRKRRHAEAVARVRMEGKSGGVRRLRLKDGPLSILDQSIVLALCLDVEVSRAEDGLLRSEMEPYISRVLSSPQDWTVHATALLSRSRLEWGSQRTADRAILQMQVLLDQQTSRLTALQSQSAVDESAPPQDRLRSLPLLSWPLAWRLKETLADRYRQIGALASAAKLFEELDLWEDVIECTIAMSRPRRAEKLVRTRLAAAPSPRLWQLLGVILDEDAPLERAWELSGHRDARTRRAQAMRAYRRREFETTVHLLEDTLQLDSRESRDWFILGSSHMRLAPSADGDDKDRLRKAADAFRECVRREPTSAEAWANLGAVLAKLQRWRPAAIAMERGLETKAQDWKMWDNLVTASIRCGAWSRAISAMRRMLELRTRDSANPGVDEAILRALVDRTIASHNHHEDTPEEIAEGLAASVDMYGQPARVHFEAVHDLVIRAAQSLNSFSLWTMAADLSQARKWNDVVPEHLRRALRAANTSFGTWQRGGASDKYPHLEPKERMEIVTNLAIRLSQVVRASPDAETERPALKLQLSTILRAVDTGELFKDEPNVAQIRQIVDEL